MNLFRSEEHIGRWLGSRAGGATIPVAKLCELAHAWWDTRIDTNWRPRTREQNQAILTDLGLTDAFWNLSAADPFLAGALERKGLSAG